MKIFNKTTINTKQKYSEFTKLTKKQLCNIRGGENPPTEETQIPTENEDGY